MKPFAISVLVVLFVAGLGPSTLPAQTTPAKDAPAAKAAKKDSKKEEKKEEPKPEKKGGMTADTFSGLKFRSIGPARGFGASDVDCGESEEQS